MFNTQILAQWSFMRLLRAGLAGWAIWQAFATGEWILLLPGGIFAMQAVFNVGCCGSAGCYVPTSNTPSGSENSTVIYEEVKTRPETTHNTP